jgi:hypothetical protein
MTARTLTRRSLVLAGAGALAAPLLRPRAALAALADAAPADLHTTIVGTLQAGVVADVRLARNADLLALAWHAPAGASVALRFATPRGSWTRWSPATVSSHAPDGGRDGAAPTAGARGAPLPAHVGEPLWTGGTRRVQVRSATALTGVEVIAADASEGFGAARLAALRSRLAGTAALALAQPVLAAGPGQPPIIARSAWAGTSNPPSAAPEYGRVELAFVHHTENPNGYGAGEVPAMLRAIYAFHRFGRGWNDIGYNFVLDLYGRIWEARAGGIDEPVTGAQAGGYNYRSTGIAVLGEFSSVRVSAAARSALEQLLAWKLALHGLPPVGRTTVRVTRAGAPYSRFPAGAAVSLPRIAGHRDADSTECPGDALYHQLPEVRSAVTALAPAAARTVLTLALAPAQPPPAAAPPAPPATPVALQLQGVLTRGGAPVPGATVLVQLRSVGARGQRVTETTLAQAQTDAAGSYTATLQMIPSKRRRASLRALYEGAPAAAGRPAITGAGVSAPLDLLAAQVLSAPPAPAPTPAGDPPPAA